MNPLIRWAKFNAVGVLGMGVQLAALAGFNRLFAGHYLAATCAALEVTLLHNFVWHERFTWRDRFNFDAAAARAVALPYVERARLAVRQPAADAAAGAGRARAVAGCERRGNPLLFRCELRTRHPVGVRGSTSHHVAAASYLTISLCDVK